MKQSTDLISVMGTLHQGNQLSSTDMPNLNAAIRWTLWSLKISSCSWKHNKSPQNTIVLGDSKLKLREIADTLKISEDGLFTILHESSRMRELFSKYVPRLLTPDQKQQRVEDSKRCLELFKQGKKDFLRRYVTMNETRIHHYIPETKRSSAEWTAAGESRSKRPKTRQWAGKVMASVFWDAHSILFIDYLEKGKTINSESYMALLDRLSAEIKENGLTCKRKKCCSTKTMHHATSPWKRWSNWMNWEMKK